MGKLRISDIQEPGGTSVLDTTAHAIKSVLQAAATVVVGKVIVRNSANDADINPVAETTFTGRLGEVQASPTANTLLGRLKDILTGIVLAAGSAIIGKVRLVTALGDEVTDDTADAIKTKATDYSAAVTLTHTTMTNANTEYSQALPANCKKFTIRCIEPIVVGSTPSNGPAFRLAYVTGKVAAPTAPFRTIGAGVVKSEDNLLLAATTLYFACAEAGKVIELEAWA